MKQMLMELGCGIYSWKGEPQVYKRPRRLEPGVNMAPLIDVVFLLLIFFVLTTDLVAEPAAVSVELASMETAQQQPREHIVVTLTKDGEIIIEGRSLEA